MGFRGVVLLVTVLTRRFTVRPLGRPIEATGDVPQLRERHTLGVAPQQRER